MTLNGSEKIILLKYEHIIYSFEARSLEIYYFREIWKFRDFMNTLRNFAKFVQMCSACIFAKFKDLVKKFI